tara:strand:+ start:13276 stop:14100 length:825 start_codon:yes stop_codon:yes gene_type:complete
MNQNQNHRQRLARLVKEGKLQPQEAEALNAAAPSRSEFEGSERARDPALPDNKFLRGEMSVEEFRAGGRRTARLMGVAFGIGFGVLFPVVAYWPNYHVSFWFVTPVLMVTTGIAFGWAMHRTLIEPAIARQIQLRNEAGPLAPLQLVDANQCPECRSEEFDIKTWRSGVMMHWILNPGLAFNELVLGQRVPRELRTCRHCSTASVGCPHCHRSIHGAHWADKNAFGNYSGLRCPSCKGRLPTLSNALAWLVRSPFAAVAWLLGRRDNVRKQVTR